MPVGPETSAGPDGKEVFSDMATLYDLKDLLADPQAVSGQQVTVQGWIRSHRKQKNFGFINFFDGTTIADVQIVYDDTLANFAEVQRFFVGSAIAVTGALVPSQGGGQGYEIQAKEIVLEGASTEDYPLQPKRHSLEYLRTIGHLRPRTRLFQAVFRVRHLAAHAIHSFFREKNFVYVHSPLITANDGEGAGETFQVTTLSAEQLAAKEPDYSADFFGRQVCLAVTGQLEAEIFAMAYKRVYTFGPTFRAENSNTKTHAAEFWMIEPEMAFCDLDQLMDVEEEFLKYILAYVLKEGAAELKFLDNLAPGLLDKLHALLGSKVARVDYREAIEILKNSGQKFDNLPVYGGDLAKEHEKYLTDVHFGSPVFVCNWPKEIKAFYMRDNGDGTVAAVDLLVPGAGELCGGSQREERLPLLIERMRDIGISEEDLSWYLDLRRYGGCVHSGFGMGFERLLIYLTGVENIRDVLPFPRTPGNCEF